MLKKDLNKIKSKLKEKDIDVLSQLFFALSDNTRLKLLAILSETQNIYVSELSYVLNTTVSAASQQLKILESADLIIREKKKQFICYKINKKNKNIKAILNIIKRS